MKAREVIPGWPRGRSCSRPSGQDEPLCWMPWKFRSPYDRAMFEDELDYERRYHARQQLMVDRWRQGIVEGEFGSLWKDGKRLPGDEARTGYYTYMLPDNSIENRPKLKMWVRP